MHSPACGLESFSFSYSFSFSSEMDGWDWRRGDAGGAGPRQARKIIFSLNRTGISLFLNGLTYKKVGDRGPFSWFFKK